MWLSIWADGFWHAVPCDEDGNVLEPHIPSENCPCCPELLCEVGDEELDEGTVIISHNQLH